MSKKIREFSISVHGRVDGKCPNCGTFFTLSQNAIIEFLKGEITFKKDECYACATECWFGYGDLSYS